MSGYIFGTNEDRLSGFNGFPLFSEDPIDEWDGVKDSGGVGEGTNGPAEMTLQDAVAIFWRVRQYRVTVNSFGNAFEVAMGAGCSISPVATPVAFDSDPLTGINETEIALLTSGIYDSIVGGYAGYSTGSGAGGCDSVTVHATFVTYETFKYILKKTGEPDAFFPTFGFNLGLARVEDWEEPSDPFAAGASVNISHDIWQYIDRPSTPAGEMDLFGFTVNLYARSGSPYTELPVEDVSVTIEAIKYWPHDPGDGGGPVWDATTGAQLRTPTTAAISAGLITP